MQPVCQCWHHMQEQVAITALLGCGCGMGAPHFIGASGGCASRLPLQTEDWDHTPAGGVQGFCTTLWLGTAGAWVSRCLFMAGGDAWQEKVYGETSAAEGRAGGGTHSAQPCTNAAWSEGAGTSCDEQLWSRGSRQCSTCHAGRMMIALGSGSMYSACLSLDSAHLRARAESRPSICPISNQVCVGNLAGWADAGMRSHFLLFLDACVV